MPRIEVDVDALADMGKQLHQIRADFQDLNTTVADADDYLGDARLSAAVHEFATNWSDERQQISRVIDRTGKMAIHGAEAYRETDHGVGGNHGGDGHGGNEQGGKDHGNGPVDTDGDGTPDFRDKDSDDDGISDAIEKDGNPQAGTDQVSGLSANTDETAGSVGNYDSSGYDAGGTTGSYDTGSYDTGSYDSGSADTGASTGSYDAGSYDTGSYDTGSYDSGPSDTGTSDASVGPSSSGDSTSSGAAEPVEQEPISGEGTLSDGGTVGLTAETTVPARTEESDGGMSPSAMALAPAGLLGAAGAAAWAAGRKSDEDKKNDEQDDEV